MTSAARVPSRGAEGHATAGAAGGGGRRLQMCSFPDGDTGQAYACDARAADSSADASGEARVAAGCRSPGHCCAPEAPPFPPRGDTAACAAEGGTGTTTRASGHLPRYPASPGASQPTAAWVPIPLSQPRPPDGGRWSLRTHMSYGALLDTVPVARARTKAVLREWGRAPAGLDDILLVVTELVSNAVAASRVLPQAGPVRVWVCCDGTRVQVQVGDDSPAPPVCVPPSVDALGGRGLMVVAGLSCDWGWFPRVGPGLAKVVWAELPADPHHEPASYASRGRGRGERRVGRHRPGYC